MGKDDVIEVRIQFRKGVKEDRDIYEYLEKVPRPNRSYEMGRIIRQLFPLRSQLTDRTVEHE